MIQIYRGHWRPIAISQVFALLYVAFMIFIPMQVMIIINNYQDINAVIQNAVLIGIFAVLTGIFCMANTVFAVRIAEATGNFIRNGIFSRIQNFSFGNLDRSATGELLTRLTSDVYQINIGVQLSLRSLLMAPFAIIVSLVLVGITSPELLWILVVVLILSIATFGTAMYVMQKQFQTRQAKYDLVNNDLQEDMGGIRVVKAFVRQDYEIKKYRSINDGYREANVNPLHTNAITMPAALFIMGLATTLLVMFGSPLVVAGTIKIGAMLAFFQYTFIIIGQMWQLSMLMPQIVSAEASAGRLKEIWDTVPDVQDTKTPQPCTPGSVKGKIVFENVNFRYDPKSETDTLKNINLTIEPGQTVAFLGANGSGKSTLVSLIPRFYDASSGRILIDGVDVKDIPQENLRNIVSIALQKAFLFSGTIVENIRFGRPESSYDDAKAAAQVADADTFVSDQQDTYDARVARKGQNFSGGQQQRISMARAFAVKPKVLILDDSTSAVDIETEGRILDALPKFLSGITRLIVASRVSTALAADKIVVLEKGEIVAVGTHKELIKSSPLYMDIFDSQLGGLKKEDIS
ncbi:MAG: ABC transporter ATP-binding protein [Methanomicrobiales archaeon]|nr:ABC transporter ATP-binding protein [Methanomicrobiales archaeon]